MSATLDKGYQEHQRGNFAGAIVHYNSVLDVNPKEAEALSLKGLALCALKRFAEAEPLLRRAVTIEPEQLNFWLNLAQFLNQNNQHEQACELLSTHIPPQSTNKPAWLSLYHNAMSAQKSETAIYALKQLLGIDLDLNVLLSLANLYVKKHDLDAATALILNVIGRCGKADNVWNALCWLLREQSRWPELFHYTSHWIKLAPDCKDAWKIHAMVAYELGLQHAAVSAYEHVLSLENSEDDDWLSYLEICVQTLELDKAKVAIGTLHGKDVMSAALLNAQVLMAIYSGEQEQGLALCRLCMQKFPQYLPIYRQYSKLTKGNLLPEQSAFLQGRLQSDEVPKQEKTMLAFVLAHAANARGNFDAAFSHYTIANKLMSQINTSRGSEYHPARAEQRVRDILINFEEIQTLRGNFGTDAVTPIFIVGMPRSGTTLLEKGITSHPDVYMGGERTEFPNLLSQILQERPSRDKFAGLLSDFASKYLQQGKIHNARFVSDKNPANYESIGLISILFPKSLIINIERDPLETCFSIFRHEFNHLWPYSTSLTDIAHQYHQYQKLIGFWQQQNINILTITYQELTLNYEQSISSIQQRIGLHKVAGELQLRFEQQTFTTLSALQVRDVVSNQNGLADQYAIHLDELRNALNLP